jgi:hypothetical protein
MDTTLEDLAKSYRIGGALDAYLKVLKWSNEPGVNKWDLSQLIHNEIDNLLKKEENEIQSKKNEN